MGKPCQFSRGFRNAMERKLSGPGGQGWDLSFMEKIPSAEPGGELSRCAVQARSQPVLPPGPSPEDKSSKGDSRTAHNGDPVTPSGPTLLCTWLPAARRPLDLETPLGPLFGRKGSLKVDHPGLVVKTGNPPQASPLHSFSHLTPGLRTTYPAQLSCPSIENPLIQKMTLTFNISRNAQAQGDFRSS